MTIFPVSDSGEQNVASLGKAVEAVCEEKIVTFHQISQAEFQNLMLALL